MYIQYNILQKKNNNNHDCKNPRDPPLESNTVVVFLYVFHLKYSPNVDRIVFDSPLQNRIAKWNYKTAKEDDKLC